MAHAEKNEQNPIDEAFLMAMMAGQEKQASTERQGINENTEPTTAKAGKLKVKKNKDADYEELFLKTALTRARDGKSVYIRPAFHERLSRIVQVIGEDKISLYAYLDNLLEYHFREFADEITLLFNERYKPIL